MRRGGECILQFLNGHAQGERGGIRDVFEIDFFCGGRVRFQFEAKQKLIYVGSGPQK